MKTAIVCMVHNGYEYLSEFLLYHLDLCDHIYMIDHNSQRDLRQLQMDRVTFIRSNHEAQFQSECTNRVIEHFNIKGKYDWLFVLDIDEFLPFTKKSALHAHLEGYAKEPALQFQWRNGVPFYGAAENPQSLIDCKSIRFFHKDSIHHKTAANITATKGNFIVPTGAHHIAPADAYNFKLPFMRRKKRYMAPISKLPLLHIVAFNKDAFIKKIKIYVEQMKYREHIKGQGGWVVRDYPDDLDDDQWLWYIANFRVSAPDPFHESKAEFFIEQPVFANLDRDQVIALRNKIMALSTTVKKTALPEEKAYLRYKKDDRHVVQNIKWFRIDAKNEIITIVPALNALKNKCEQKTSLACDLLKLARLSGSLKTAYEYLKQDHPRNHITGKAYGLNFEARRNDWPVLREVILKDEYECLESLFKPSERPKILDIGAHIGAFGLKVFSHTKGASIYSVEAAPDTADLLEKNMRLNPEFDWKIIRGAVWKDKNPIYLNRGASSLSHKVGANDTGETVTGFTPEDLLAKTGWDEIDMVKMDIEGAETEVIPAADTLFSRARLFAFEIHNNDGAALRANLQKHFAHAYQMQRKGSGKPVFLMSKNDLGAMKGWAKL